MTDFQIYQSDSQTKVELKNVSLVKNRYGYCLNITYRVENDREILAVNLPCLHLPIRTDILTISREHDMYFNGDYTANIGFGDLNLKASGIGGSGPAFTITVIEEKTKEMTLEEIEKKLGHKVKIVNK